MSRSTGIDSRTCSSLESFKIGGFDFANTSEKNTFKRFLAGSAVSFFVDGKLRPANENSEFLPKDFEHWTLDTGSFSGNRVDAGDQNKAPHLILI